MKPSPRSHRRPPLPHWEKGAGFCRWCGAACEPNRRWHGPCVTAYKIACWPAEARKAVWARDKGICAGCGINVAEQQARERIRNREEEETETNVRFWLKRFEGHPAHGSLWQADHITPLVEANRDDLGLWSLTNLRLLCTRCHKGETKALAGRRAAARKETVA